MTINATCYECEICLNMNHNTKLHCSTCGAVPAKYSILGTTARIIERDYVSAYIPFVVAKGADRVEWHHTSRVYLRTVKADYYAEV